MDEGRHPRISAPAPILAIHRLLFVEHPLWSLAGATAIYACIVLGLGKRLEISSNYFVLLPVLTGALGYGLFGGLVAGALGLPANLALFAVLGHPEFSPASKPIAELSGLLVGGASGYLAEYFRQLQLEIARRVRTEQSLRDALEKNKLLLLELHHRVKNNLNVIKSLIQLQRNRSDDPEFLEAADKLLSRVFAIARAHDLLYGEGGIQAIPPEDYLTDILDVYAAGENTAVRVLADIRAEGRLLSVDNAVPLGLILNETVTNALKYAFSADAPDPTVLVRFRPEGSSWLLEVRDNGRGFDAGASDNPGLGLKIVRGLAVRLGGQASWSQDAGTVFRLTFPSAPAIAD